MDKPIIGPREIVYKNQFLQVYRVNTQFQNHVKTLFVVDDGLRAGVLLIRGNDVLLVRQYRLLVDDLAWEIPGGKVDDNETPREAAMRECVEETGLRCRQLEPLIHYHPGLDTCQNPTYIFYSTDFEEVAGHKPDGHEVTELVWVPFSRCLEMVFNQQIVDCLSAMAILAYSARAQGAVMGEKRCDWSLHNQVI